MSQRRGEFELSMALTSYPAIFLPLQRYLQILARPTTHLSRLWILLRTPNLYESQKAENPSLMMRSSNSSHLWYPTQKKTLLYLERSLATRIGKGQLPKSKSV